MQSQTFNMTIRCNDNQVREFSVNRSPIFDAENKFDGLVGIMLDITTYSNIEKALLQSLQDQLEMNNLLRKEMNHRVFNDLQLISTLIDMRKRETNSSEIIGLLNSIASKINAIAAVHRILFREHHFDNINLKDVIFELKDRLKELGIDGNKKINIIVNGDDIIMNIKNVTYCSLIINELITNALKHGFENKQEGRIIITLAKKENEIHISVSNNGNRIPDGIDILNANGLGFIIIKNLIFEQLKGTIINNFQNGFTEFLIKFKNNVGE